MQENNNFNPEPYPALFTVPEACAALRVQKSKLYEMMRAGDIRPIKLGARSTRIPRNEILRLLDHQEGR